MDDVHLVNCFQLTLKTRDEFEAAFDAILNTKLSDYLKLSVSHSTAWSDWPAQLYSRQIVYKRLLKIFEPSDVPDNTASSNQHADNSYTAASSCRPGTCDTNIHVSTDRPIILCINIHLIGAMVYVILHAI